MESQALCTGVRVHTRKDRQRHGDINFMDYQIETNPDDGDVSILSCQSQHGEEGEVYSSDSEGDPEEVPTSAVNLDAHLPSYGSEHAGVAHLVHGWVQQAQPKKVCFVACFHFQNFT